MTIERQTQPSFEEITRARRVLVLGSSGSGKTYLSARLGELLHIEVLHLDAYFWRPGWVSTAEHEWRGIVSQLTRKSSWIMDGTYENTLDLRLPEADTVVVIEQSRWICLWGVLKRRLFFDGPGRTDAPAGQRIDLPFLRYIWEYPSATRPLVHRLIQQYGPDKRLIVLTGAREVRQLLRSVRRFIEGARSGKIR